MERTQADFKGPYSGQPHKNKKGAGGLLLQSGLNALASQREKCSIT